MTPLGATLRPQCTLTKDRLVRIHRPVLSGAIVIRTGTLPARVTLARRHDDAVLLGYK